MIPLIAGLAALFRAPGEEPSRELRMFRCVALAGLIGVGMYAAMKAAYLSTVFATRVEERNIIYIAPLLLVGTALAARAAPRQPVGAARRGAYARYLVGYALYHSTQFPYEMNVQLYSDALGLAILQQANRYLAWTPEHRPLGAARDRRSAGCSPCSRSRGCAAGRLAGGRRSASSRVGIVGVESHRRDRRRGRARTRSRARRRDARAIPSRWVDDVTHRKPTLYIGEAEVDQNPEWLLEFWNRSIVQRQQPRRLGPRPRPVGRPEPDR